MRDSLSEPGSVPDWQGQLYLYPCCDFASPQLRWYGNICSLFTFSPCLFQTCLHWGTIYHRISQVLETKWDIHTLSFLPVKTQRDSVNKHGFSRPSAMFFSLLISVLQDMLQHILRRSRFPHSLVYDVQLCTGPGSTNSHYNVEMNLCPNETVRPQFSSGWEQLISSSPPGYISNRKHLQTDFSFKQIPMIWKGRLFSY